MSEDAPSASQSLDTDVTPTPSIRDVTSVDIDQLDSDSIDQLQLVLRRLQRRCDDDDVDDEGDDEDRHDGVTAREMMSAGQQHQHQTFGKLTACCRAAVCMEVPMGIPMGMGTVRNPHGPVGILNGCEIKIGFLLFQARGHRRRPNLALVFWGSFCVVVYFVTDACLLCCVFSFSVLSQETGWEERLRNDLFCVGLEVKP